MKKKVFLIEPPENSNEGYSRYPIPGFFAPLWALSLASYLKARRTNIDINILDSQIISFDEIEKRILKVKPDFVGISPTLFSYKTTLALAKTAKIAGAKVVLGGHQATGLRKEILENRGPYSRDYRVDAVIQHDGEKAFCEYIEGKPLSKIKNLVYQTKNGVKENPVESLDLNKLPLVDRSLVKMQDYFKRFEKATFTNSEGVYKRPINIYTQRGCRWREQSGGCVFCSRMEPRLRIRNPRKVVREIEYLINAYRVDCLREFSDDFLGAGPHWLKEFERQYKRIKNKPLMEICVRADRITPETIKFLKNINVFRCALGIESFSNYSLARMRKGINAEQNKRAIELLGKNGIRMSFCIILGVPGETEKSVKETIDFAGKWVNSNGGECTIYLNIRLMTMLPNSLCWDWLLAKTGSKYRGKDKVSISEMRHDWFKHFCRINEGGLRRILKDITSYPKSRFRFDEYLKHYSRR